MLHRLVIWSMCVLQLLHAASGDQQTFDCALRRLAVEFALRIQPDITAAQLQDLADALNGSPEFGQYACNVTPPAVEAAPVQPPLQLISPAWFVDAVSGADNQEGTQAAPFRSIARALAASRSSGAAVRAIYLRSGTFFLASPEQGGATLVLGPRDSGLTLAAFPGETVWVSGAVPLPSLSWSRVAGRAGNVWQARIATPPPAGFPGLRWNGTRLVRARFPNADPELGFGSSLEPTAWIPPAPQPTPTVWTPPVPNRTDTNNGYGIQFYTLGIGGGCAAYDPPAGFWCSNATMRFGGFSAEPRWPSGMHIGPGVLPNAPYADATTATVHAWRSGHWFTRMHTVAAFDAGSGNYTFGHGGFQGGEGTDADEEFYIENVAEELDAPGEWFYAAANGSLMVVWNATDGVPPPAEAGSFAVPQLRELFNVTGTQGAPVANVSFLGLGFRDAALSYLQPHGLPSSGDWALARTGALFLEGTVGTELRGCVFDRLDGTAVFLSGFTRGARIVGNEFRWLGESAIALWGYGAGSPVPGMGPDLTGGDQPRGTLIAGNIAREIGIWEKQSSFVFQAEAGLTNISGNIAYNGPRAGINFNEDSIGGSTIERNLIFNMCRESGDHGPFNSWGRTAYIHNAGPDGRPTTQKLWDTIQGNLFIANYNSMAALDNDDASAYYNSTRNVFAYSPFGLKSDFGGHDNLHSHSARNKKKKPRRKGKGKMKRKNVYAYLRDTDWFDGPAAVWITFGSQFVGHEDAFHHNLVVQDWCAPNDGTCTANFTIGQVCNVSSAPTRLSGLSGLPPIGSTVLLGPLSDPGDRLLGLGLRHCDYVVSATPLGIGLAQDYQLTVRAALNGDAGAISFQSVNYPDHFLAIDLQATAPVGQLVIQASPAPADASWQPRPGLSDTSNFSFVSLSADPRFHGGVMTLSYNNSAPCAWPQPAGDVYVSSIGAGRTQTWMFNPPAPPAPPPPPGIAPTDLHDNTYYLPAGGTVFECGQPLAAYQASCESCDPRSVAYSGFPPDEVILDAARAALGLQQQLSMSGRISQ